ncbi:MAG: hypothetical protein ACRENP_24455 [Longimicrobiales bacterium]
MRRTLTIVLMVTGLLAGATIFLSRPAGADLSAVPPTPIAGTSTNLVRLAVDPAQNYIDIVVGPVALAAGQSGTRAPIQLVTIPANGWIRGFSWFMHDAAGKRLPDDLLHHVNLIDPDRSELFSSVARRVIAAGRETRAVEFPSIIGYPISSGTRLLVVTMLSNPDPQPYQAFMTVRLNYVPARKWLRPLAVFPFSLDVMGAVGEKEFVVPHGRTVRSWVASPHVDARILALGGHGHDYTRRIALTDEATGDTLWAVAPKTDQGRLLEIPRSTVARRGGIRLKRNHRYRVTIEYFNPGLSASPHGGMGVVAGIVSSRAPWPRLDPTNADYRADMVNIITMPQRVAQSGHGLHVH